VHPHRPCCQTEACKLNLASNTCQQLEPEPELQPVTWDTVCQRKGAMCGSISQHTWHPCSLAQKHRWCTINQSMLTSVAMKFIENSCQSFTKNHLFDDVLTVSTSPSMTTIQIAFDGELRHPHLLLAGSAKLLGSNTSQSVLSGDIATHGPLWCTPTHAMSMCISVPGGLLQRQPKPFRHTSAAPTRAVPRPGFKTI
jgi:hypothetical protein